MTQAYVSIDVAKHHLDLAVWGTADCNHLPTTRRASRLSATA